ncbi:MAG: cell division protein FtsZ [Clostridia bacterium]|nr:cell division protein FtsZ [Clostridia bacterium]
MTAMTTKIKVVGVGGCGTNVVVSMIKSGLRGVEFYMVNTDKKHLENCVAKGLTPDEVSELGSALHTINIGEKATKGQGAGADPTMGEQAAEESRKQLTDMLAGTDLLFIVAGMGGGTGTGASPVIAKLAKEINPEVLIISAVTKPLRIEFGKKMAIAEKGIEKLQKYVDSLIIIPNQSMVEGDMSITLPCAYEKVNKIISNAVRSISDIINFPSQINVDFADIKRVMKGKGYSHIGLGMGEGPATSDRMIKAVKAAASTDILNTNIAGATGLIINIQASSDITYNELEEANIFIAELVAKDVDCIFGYQTDDSLDQKIIVTIIAAGCKAENIPMNKRNVYNPTPQPQMGMPNRNAGFSQQPRPVQPQPQQGPISQVAPPRPAPQPQQPPVQPMRIDSTQGGGINNETPSFMKRFLGRKRDNR